MSEAMNRARAAIEDARQAVRDARIEVAQRRDDLPTDGEMIAKLSVEDGETQQ